MESWPPEPRADFRPFSDVDDEGALVQVAELEADVAPELLELAENGLYRFRAWLFHSLLE